MATTQRVSGEQTARATIRVTVSNWSAPAAPVASRANTQIEAGVSFVLPFAGHELGEQPGPWAVSFGEFDLRLGTALRHGVHDSEHHMLDVRRGVAALKLVRGRSALNQHGWT
jgi:hypothetical protein